MNGAKVANERRNVLKNNFFSNSYISGTKSFPLGDQEKGKA